MSNCLCLCWISRAGMDDGKEISGKFPGCLVVRVQCFHLSGPIPSLRPEISPQATAHCGQKKKKKQHQVREWSEGRQSTWFLSPYPYKEKAHRCASAHQRQQDQGPQKDWESGTWKLCGTGRWDGGKKGELRKSDLGSSFCGFVSGYVYHVQPECEL